MKAVAETLGVARSNLAERRAKPARPRGPYRKPDDKALLPVIRRIVDERPRWSEDEKVRIVLESLAGPRLVSATARRHGIARSQLLAWRRTLCAEHQAGPMPGFVPAVIAREPPTAATPKTASRLAKPGDDRIEIVLARGRRIIVGAGVDPAALSRILDVLERR